MFDRFTNRAKQAMSFARKEALKLNHDCIGTEHILLGLLRAHDGTAAKTLTNMDIDLDKVRAEVEAIVRPQTSPVTIEQLPFTQRAKNALGMSMEEASWLGHRELGTEHLLLGLVKENDGIAAHVLLNLGVELTALRRAVVTARGAGPAPEPPSESSPPEHRRFDRFTNRAEQAMSFALQEAQQLNHCYIGTEHILLGLLREGRGLAAHVLENMGIDLMTARHEVEKLDIPGRSMVTMGQLPFTPGAKKVLELSMEEASQLAQHYIGTEHLLLGLVKEDKGIAARVLSNLGAELAALRRAVIAARDAGPSPGHPSSPAD